MDKRFEGRNVFITGAGSGFGRKTAQRFAEEGAATIYMVDYNQERLDATAPSIEEHGATAIKINTDLSVMENCSDAIAQALAHDPKLDVLVANAAAAPLRAGHALSPPGRGALPRGRRAPRAAVLAWRGARRDGSTQIRFLSQE